MRTLCGVALCLISMGCTKAPEAKKEGTGHVVLKPLTDSASYAPKVRHTVYVPIYSSVYWGFDDRTTEIAATLSIRNTSPRNKLVVHSAKYYDSEGKEIRNYIATASELGPLATADFVVQQRDTTGGTGASFLVDWSSAESVDQPVIEAVMIGQHGNAGISFTSVGRALQEPSIPR